ncbi:hypothetical protein LCGC14_0728180 [marine sediment metagenome]|uniref:Uncharacterized protein n=1 Tax=marine sediment metagenome TaxID=412755 RepID=A0A0F9QAE8_9ZZZZ
MDEVLEVTIKEASPFLSSNGIYALRIKTIVGETEYRLSQDQANELFKELEFFADR